MITIVREMDLLWELRQILRDFEQVVVTEGVDKSVVLLSYEGPETGESFSPLGDALLKIHRKLVDLERQLSD